MTYGTVMVALADPTRRALFESLRSRPHTVGELARIAKIQQPSVSQHLRILREARLVRDRREGTRRYYSASQEGLAELRRYVERMWDDVLTAYAAQDPNPSKRRVAAPAKRRGAR
jgi:DNA-binding transcriptional ArsR family regulator